MKNHTTNSFKWLFDIKWQISSSLDSLLKPIKLLNEQERWRRVANILKLSKTAKLRLEWIIYYYQGYSAVQTARHFGISRKTFYKWYPEFDKDNIYSLYRLEDKSRAPQHVRQREIASSERLRIVVSRF